MPTEIYLVKVGMTMTEGMVSEWYIPDGDEVTTTGTDPSDPDTDRDGLQDGTELGYTAGVADPDSIPNNHVLSEDDHASVSVAALPEPELALSASLYEATGDVVVFALVLTNAGVSAATDIAVKSMPPAGLRYTGHVAQQGDYDPLTGVWTVGTVEGGAELTLHISATAEAIATS